MAADTELPNIEQPERRDAKIWRYIRFNRFRELVKISQIQLTQLEAFDDQFEGSMLPATRNAIDEHFASSGIRPNVTSYPSFRARAWHYATCWCLLEHEHEGLWKTYGDVALVSTYQQLVDAFDNQCWAGLVRYINYERHDPAQVDDLSMTMLKRREFLWEREVRVVCRFIRCSSTPPTDRRSLSIPIASLFDQPARIYQPVSLRGFVNEIRVSPFARPCLENAVRRTLGPIGLEHVVRASDLLKPPCR
jgi:hypothetical protein